MCISVILCSTSWMKSFQQRSKSWVTQDVSKLDSCCTTSAVRFTLIRRTSQTTSINNHDASTIPPPILSLFITDDPPEFTMSRRLHLYFYCPFPTKKKRRVQSLFAKEKAENETGTQIKLRRLTALLDEATLGTAE